MTGIISYGFYVPRFRIKTDVIAATWGRCADKIGKSLLIEEKAVAGRDEDILTMAYEASTMAFEQKERLKAKVGAVFIGSETFPYAVKPTATSLATWVGLSHHYLAYDAQFACKAGTGALLSAAALVKSKDIDTALVCAADKANAAPRDALEYTAGSGANAWLLGNSDVAIEIVDWRSYSSDTPDFWRRSKMEYPSHAGRFTGDPAYFTHIREASQSLLQKSGMRSEQFTHAVFHMPNGSFPLKVGKQLGFTRAQIEASYIVPYLGNSYAASALMGLVAALEKANNGDLIFFASYGSGAGSDAMILRCTERIKKIQKPFRSCIENDKHYLDYTSYIQLMGII
jgi:hydroxymethylglutaryl-CoA synthase